MKKTLAPKYQCVKQVFQCTALVTGIDTDKVINGNIFHADAVEFGRQVHVAAEGTMPRIFPVNPRQVTVIWKPGLTVVAAVCTAKLCR